jgi:hypothetical protein
VARTLCRWHRTCPLLSRGAGAAVEVAVGLRRRPYLDLSLTVRLGTQTVPPEPIPASPTTMETLSPVSSPTPPWCEDAARPQPSTVGELRMSRRILAPNLVWDAFWSPAVTIPGWDPKVSLGEMLLRSSTMDPLYPVTLAGCVASTLDVRGPCHTRRACPVGMDS